MFANGLSRILTIVSRHCLPPLPTLDHGRPSVGVCLVLLISTFVAPHACAQQQSKSTTIERLLHPSENRIVPLKSEFDHDHLARVLELRIPQLMDSARVQGLSAAIIKNSEVVWDGHFGVKNSDTGEPVSANTVFEAASLGKPVFAYAVMQLVEQGLIALDVPLSDYWTYEDIKHNDAHEQITARMILAHTTGLPNWRRQSPLTLGFAPGERFSYSGEGYVYLQKVVQHLLGEPIQDIMQERVFTPLKMTKSSYLWADQFESLSATGHGPSGKPRRKGKPKTVKVAATLHTTVLDYAKFLVALLNSEGLKTETAAQMLEPQVHVDPKCVMCPSDREVARSESLAWGLGWGLQLTREGRSFWHWGDNDHFKSYSVAFAKQKLAVVYFTNSFNGLDLRDELVYATVGGEHPAFDWLPYEQYNSAMNSIRDALKQTFVQEGISEGIGLYREIARMAPEVVGNELLLSNLGFELMGERKFEEAIAVFGLNAEAFPDKWQVYDSLGLAHMRKGSKEEALENYRRTLELNPDNKRARDAIKRLQNE